MQIKVMHRSTYNLRGIAPWFKVIYFSADDGGDICHTSSRNGSRKGLTHASPGEVGYLKVGYTDVKVAREMFKTPYHFATMTKGYCCDPEELGDKLHLYSTTFDELKKERRAYLRSAKDFFFVDYIQVADEYRRRGIGTKLYTEVAKWLAENEGQVLYASGIQSAQAKAAWAHMAAGDLPVKKSRKNKRGSATRFYMDFRND